MTPTAMTRLLLAALVGAGFAASATAATTSLADAPILATNSVPPNIMMTLSVEWPTGTVAAYNDNYSAVTGYECGGRDGGVGSCYFPARAYLSYFDPEKCYDYDTSLQYFVPKGASAANHNCTSSNGRYSGNYLNWASAHALDGFRWTMTGGDRAIDTSTTTVIEKSIHTGQGGYNQFPIKRVRNTDYTSNSVTTPAVEPSTITPQSWSTVYSRVTNDGNPLGPGTPRTGRLIQMANNTNWLNSFPTSGGLRYFKVQLAGTNNLSLAEFQVLQTNSSGWTNCANEGQTCSYTGTGEIRYGTGGQWSAAQVFVSGSPCNNTVFGDPAPGQAKSCQYRLLTNLAQGKTATQSSTYSTAVAGRAVDGTTDGVFANNSVTHTNADAQAWWQVDLGSARTDIRAIAIFNRTDCCGNRLSNFYVFGSASDMSASTPDQLISNPAVWMVQQNAQPPDTWTIAPNTGDGATDLLNVRVKVCDSSVGLESNCKAYGSTYKPTGVIQDNADQMRFGVMAYMNVDGTNTMGGVLRSPLKYVGPNTIVPNGTPTTNARAEITSGGLFVADPESLVASDIKSSGAINYINKFGKLGTKASMKSQDTASEMFLEALRYVRGATAATTQFSPAATWVGNAVDARDGFPVYTNWSYVDGSGNPIIDKQPIQYSCQKTYFVGIGDTNTWCDTFGPGDTHTGTSCDASHNGSFPSETNITSDINTGYLLDRLGANEGLGSLGSTYIANGRGDGYNIAAYAYFANTHDLLVDDNAKPWTIGRQWAQTYWVDVRETGSFNGTTTPKNQYWLAGRYGGFDSITVDDYPPAGYDPLNDTYFTGERPDTLNASLRAVFSSIRSKQQSGAPGSISTNNLASAGGGYLVRYNSQDWTGDVFGEQLSLAADGTPVSALEWNVSTRLDAQDYDTGRKIITWNPTSAQGVPFRWNSVTSNSTMTATQQSYFGATDTIRQDVVNYLRGQRSNENINKYRVRTHVLGDIVNSQPLFVGAPPESYSDEFNPGFSSFYTSASGRTPMLYVGANDGMLHGVNALVTSASLPNGNEVFAYVPSFVIPGPQATPTPFVDGIASRTNVTFLHKYLVDGQAYARSVDFGRTGTTASFGSADWHTLLVGGLGKGGKGYYALDVSTPSNWTGTTTEATLGTTIPKWEYTEAEMGYSYGTAIIAKTKKNGWVVVLPSGHNTSTGKGFIVILNAKTGALIQKIYTSQGDLTTPAGLAQINAGIPDATDFTMDSVYASDLLGNVWRFDLTAASGTYPAPVLLTTLKDGSGNRQPITTFPKIGVYPDTLERWVFVGTGRLLDTADLGLKTQQSFYGFRDGLQSPFATTQVDLTAFPFDRSKMVSISYSDLLTGSSAVTASKQGWYLDFNGANTDGTTERMVFSPVVNDGVVAFATQIPSSDPCAPGISSRIYALDFGNARSNVVSTTGSSTIVAYYSDATTLLKPELVVDANGKVQMIVSTGDTTFKQGAPLKEPGFSSPVRLNWREVLQ